MAKPSRNSDPSSIRAELRTFFVTSKTSQGKSLLQTERMATLFIDVLRSYVAAKKFKINDFVVMPNHIHLLITLDQNISIEKAVQLIKGNFSYRVKKELGYQHEVWQPGFSEDQVMDRESFLQHKSYIDNNPVKAGLARAPGEWPYCSAFLRKNRARSG